ncbi:hypothetical protein OG462_44080 [Streptomyces sp. NBC_01077]|uniref:hypothetical protein n=1 Tax=Streptomyces sp. NBC_01077 TaxID=2903746 RepID=UPI0038700E02|nr:hypothetical protein OG462_00925 [Streptomyces sp. NBC_01077]WSV43710.1 hypothetical protein OG462_44080 [Streptomyces sp. NBC_01077]
MRTTTRFSETMLGTVSLDGHERSIRLDLDVETDELLRPWRTVHAKAKGRIRVTGLTDDSTVTADLEISPLKRRRIRYRLSFNAGGRRLTLDGWKSVTALRPVASMTTLPFTLHEEDGTRAGTGTLRFPLSTSLVPFLRSFRFPRQAAQVAVHSAPRWNGENGRTEVWYTTLTDPLTGTGIWLHHEVVAPTDGSPPFAHGWVAAFPRSRPPQYARFGPQPWGKPRDGFLTDDVHALPDRLAGAVEDFSWELTEHGTQAPLFTFPAWSWRHALLPAAQMLPSGRSTYTGTFRFGTTTLSLTDAPGASARIYGHGNARRWSWLHADLGDGDVLEVVAATSMRPLLRSLPPMVFLRLRRGTTIWPRRAERTAVGWAGWRRFRADLGLPSWTVTGRAGLRRIRVEVTQPAQHTLSLKYEDPDGSIAVCSNSERSDARIVLEQWRGGWRTEAEWTLNGTAHAEVGHR